LTRRFALIGREKNVKKMKNRGFGTGSSETKYKVAMVRFFTWRNSAH
jgi:hypothetical protein